jgi:subtilase family serine protease
MSGRRRMIGAVAVTAAMASMTFVAAAGSASASTSGNVPLTGSVPAFALHVKPTGNLAGSTKLTIQVWLKPRSGAQNFAAKVSTPGSALYGHYLSPSAYASRFGASAKTAGAVTSWLRSKGFATIRTDAGRDYVRATGSVSKINAAFRTVLKTYPSSAGRAMGSVLHANSSSVSVPKQLAGSVLGVTGLSNAAPLLPLLRPSATTISGRKVKAGPPNFKGKCSQFYGQHTVSGLPKQFGVTTFPTEVCGYSGSQMRSAYHATMAATGKGQTIALIELGLTPDMFLTLKDYAKVNGLPAPSASRYAELSLGKNTCGDPFDIEEQIDVESSYAMAPDAHQLVVGGDGCAEGDQGLQGLFDADLAVINGNGHHPLASAASNSWEGNTEEQPPFLTKIEHSYLMKAAAEGVGMYFSSGDGSGVLSPSDDPFAIAVGGTTVGIGKAGHRMFETGWSTGFSFLGTKRWIPIGEQGAAGGGPSLVWRQPWYQKGHVPAALAKAPGNRPGLVRSVPDISADADPFTGFATGLLNFHKNKPPTYVQEDFGGTSLASPLVAGIVTAAQQGQHHVFGFIDPLLYKLHGSKVLHATLPLTGKSNPLFRGTACDENTCGAPILTTFDDQNKNMFGYTGQVTLKGYDNMSGVGTPGPAFIKGLRG